MGTLKGIYGYDIVREEVHAVKEFYYECEYGKRKNIIVLECEFDDYGPETLQEEDAKDLIGIIDVNYISDMSGSSYLKNFTFISDTKPPINEQHVRLEINDVVSELID